MSLLTKVFSTLIETQELAEILRNRVPVYLLDASYNVPGVAIDIHAGHRSARIPGAKFFEVDEVADKSSGFSHMLPSNALFIDYMKKLRIKNDGKLLVCYDQIGVISAPRAWWTFKVFGRTNIAVLNGGLPKWVKESLPTESGEYPLYADPSGERDEEYRYRLDQSQVVDLKGVTALSKLLSEEGLKETQLVDARAQGRFNGTAPEPRPGVRSGSVPGSVNLFFKTLFEADGTLKPIPEVRQAFIAAGVSLDNTTHTVHMCGSGMTACINLLAHQVLGKTRTSVYDGSWTEYATTPEPVLTAEELAQFRRAFLS